MSMTPRGPKRFWIWCGDDRYEFRYSPGRTLRLWSQLRRVFEEKIHTMDFFTGLVLEDESGTRWKPTLQVVLTQVGEKQCLGEQ